jgi:archaellum biogenesis ATPase FlaH/5S rRNA maturation endonuclease (ribonuclease M5)
MSTNIVYGTEACEKCQQKGGDIKGNNRVLYSDGGYYCFACGDYKSGNNTTVQQTNYTMLPMFTVENVLAKRDITPKVIADYDLSSCLDESNQMFIKFPLHDVNGAETNAQYRAVDTSTGTLLHDIKFSRGKINLPLMGWKLVKPTTKALYICEGLTDALILASKLDKESVSLGMTSATAASKVASHILAYAKDRKIVLCFDNDEAGRLAETKFISTVERHDAEFVLYKLNIPKEHKDVGDWVASGTFDLQVSPVCVNGLIGASEIAERVGTYLDGMGSSTQIELSFSPTLSNALRLMPGKLIGIIGASGEGKSTLAEHLVMEVLQQKLNVFVVSQEMLPEEFAVKLLRMVRNQPLDSPKFIKTLTEDEKAEIVKQTAKLIRLLNMTDSFGEMSVAAIDKHIHKLTSIGCHPDLIVIDHLLAITRGCDKDEIMDTCKELKSIARRHETCVLLLTHTSKPVKGRGIQQPQLNSAYGSSGLPIYCDAALGVSSDKQALLTLVELVKVERMGGCYANVTFNYKDYLLTEVENGASVDYTNEVTDEHF